jgi:MFS family permease
MLLNILDSQTASPATSGGLCLQVNISVAIIPMAQDFGWSPTVSGLVQSSFFWGYALSQIPGGYLNSNIGGRKVLPSGVSLWSAATAAVPLVAGSIPGVVPRHLPDLVMLLLLFYLIASVLASSSLQGGK